jgi:hypothetical protein
MADIPDPTLNGLVGFIACQTIWLLVTLNRIAKALEDIAANKKDA